MMMLQLLGSVWMHQPWQRSRRRRPSFFWSLLLYFASFLTLYQLTTLSVFLKDFISVLLFFFSVFVLLFFWLVCFGGNVRLVLTVFLVAMALVVALLVFKRSLLLHENFDDVNESSTKKNDELRVGVVL